MKALGLADGKWMREKCMARPSDPSVTKYFRGNISRLFSITRITRINPASINRHSREMPNVVAFTSHSPRNPGQRQKDDTHHQ